jgi:hypothetical protein
MVLAALLLLSPLPLLGDAVLPVTNSTAIVAAAPSDNSSLLLPKEFVTPGVPAPAVSTELSASSQPKLLEMPAPKVGSDSMESFSAEPGAAQPAAFALEPIKPVTSRNLESRNQKRLWYALAAAGHAGAAFDAWSTRRALSGNYGTEADPLMRPFAHSGAIYVATQVGPVIMDLIGRHAMTSEHVWMRKLWWVPQSVGASMSFRAGIHNVGVVQ